MFTNSSFSEEAFFHVFTQLFSWIPWEDKLLISYQYKNLESWKERYTEQQDLILKAFYQIKTTNGYVNYQKLLYLESQDHKTEEIKKFWELASEDCPVGFQWKLVELAVRKNLSLELLLQHIDLEVWDECARKLSKRITISDMSEF